MSLEYDYALRLSYGVFQILLIYCLLELIKTTFFSRELLFKTRRELSIKALIMVRIFSYRRPKRILHLKWYDHFIKLFVLLMSVFSLLYYSVGESFLMFGTNFDGYTFRSEIGICLPIAIFIIVLISNLFCSYKFDNRYSKEKFKKILELNIYYILILMLNIIFILFLYKSLNSKNILDFQRGSFFSFLPRYGLFYHPLCALLVFVSGLKVLDIGLLKSPVSKLQQNNYQSLIRKFCVINFCFLFVTLFLGSYSFRYLLFGFDEFYLFLSKVVFFLKVLIVYLLIYCIDKYSIKMRIFDQKQALFYVFIPGTILSLILTVFINYK